MIAALLMVAIGVAGLLLWLLVKEIEKQNKPNLYRSKASNQKSKKHHSKPQANASNRKKTSAASSYSAVPAAVKSELIRLAGNEKIALRLVKSLKQRNPERSEVWCWEKAIFDIERDRSI